MKTKGNDTQLTVYKDSTYPCPHRALLAACPQHCQKPLLYFVKCYMFRSLWTNGPWPTDHFTQELKTPTNHNRKVLSGFCHGKCTGLVISRVRVQAHCFFGTTYLTWRTFLAASLILIIFADFNLSPAWSSNRLRWTVHTVPVADTG